MNSTEKHLLHPSSSSELLADGLIEFENVSAFEKWGLALPRVTSQDYNLTPIEEIRLLEALADFKAERVTRVQPDQDILSALDNFEAGGI